MPAFVKYGHSLPPPHREAAAGGCGPGDRLVGVTLASRSVAVAEAPGCNTRYPGSTEASTGCSPRRYDGGASCGALPHVLGLVPSVQSSVAPAVSVENGTNNLWYGLPLSFRFCT